MIVNYERWRGNGMPGAPDGRGYGYPYNTHSTPHARHIVYGDGHVERRLCMNYDEGLTTATASWAYSRPKSAYLRAHL